MERIKQNERQNVALLTESVDRNSMTREPLMVLTGVALLTESVDRNAAKTEKSARNAVALLTESVDRNASLFMYPNQQLGRSPHGERG